MATELASVRAEHHPPLLRSLLRLVLSRAVSGPCTRVSSGQSDKGGLGFSNPQVWGVLGRDCCGCAWPRPRSSPRTPASALPVATCQADLLVWGQQVALGPSEKPPCS